MPHSMAKVWVHVVWSTQDRVPILKGEFRTLLTEHIRRKIEEIGCAVRIIGGVADHVHVLFALPPEKALAEVMQAAKGESAHWFNQQKYMQGRFAWQTGYGGFSVSPQTIKSVETYIRRQEEHHKRMTFWEEYERFVKMSEIPTGTEPG